MLSHFKSLNINWSEFVVDPRAKHGTQIYHRRVHGDDRHLEINRVGFVRKQCPDFWHEFTRQVLPRSPVALFIGGGQVTPDDPVPEAHMICQSSLCSQTGINITQALAKSHLRKTKRQKVVPRRMRVTTRSRHVARGICALKLPVWDARHDLREDGLNGVHPEPDLEKRPPCSNREQAQNTTTPCENASYITHFLISRC